MVGQKSLDPTKPKRKPCIVTGLGCRVLICIENWQPGSVHAQGVNLNPLFSYPPYSLYMPHRDTGGAERRRPGGEEGEASLKASVCRAGSLGPKVRI